MIDFLQRNIKQIVVSFGLVIVFSLYAGQQEDNQEARQVHANTNIVVDNFVQNLQTQTTSSTTETQTTPPVPPTTQTPLPAPAIVQKPRGIYYDGQYTGISADAYYGNVQVQVIISGGRITDVKFLDHPQDRRTSIAINNEAMVYLKQEVIQAQNAKVDIVSGATATSEAFIQSLSSALQQAKI